ncbi:PREDICTED: spermatogenic leucine zipper protein 1 [Propithecus coquereli]|uniref:spermatogenic leucine zipper protein 1 n=1 Tax=Propithecus coquereli TaxID=379532 RepID=UPI00063F900E|nr:PREDICTED: spermatogenic leucine zipper protein 1 [Propithecus coquereli]
MATSAKSAKMPTLSETLKPTPDLHQESLDPRIMVALFEIGLLPPSTWGSLPSLKNSSHQVTEQQTEQKFQNLLKEIKDILKDVADFEEITEAKELCEESNISKDMSELKDKIRGLDEINKMLLKNLLVSLDPEKEQNTKKQEVIVETQNSKSTVQDFARDLENHSEERKALHEIPPSNEKAKCRFLNVQEENQKLRNNMEQLLQEVERWSEQHTELSELIKSYQKSQKDIKESLGVCFQAQPNNEASVQHRLEEQVRKLSHDTRSLHLLAASLENQCQILQQRVEVLKELQHQKAGTLQGKAIQINCKQDKKDQKPSETGKAETYKQNMQEMEGIFQKKDRFYRSLDVCRNKKARNNRFNTRIARGLLGIKRPTSSLR